mmetsp:Transcript_26763/g.56891  ORF Transcript_26763/g.56891 Transcript_26763/m.56891 type:complete len:338 (-) Transcript_26763:379-1392(-)|eukprot:CAMPEP_0172545182 /NCGR_PEP_ID=MMETSP1067-20121228/15164_1 /TAXON_ID=265564 ORGANISM="Thalassiosira punctigera, Strain Tpunct2005C2" /NCGR_SAMPLE_ID=MMETSP1067 /ASSEMBLY_ACC=CAM_ASM_000444 /LENGTH=337 /DNA_ID=CAMNT_0013331883 /DNA_START=171 /DNA_END=1184 /DNA_ORIENTATION=-
MANTDEKKIEASVSTEEVEQAKAEIAEEIDEESVASGEFEVTKEEMSIIRAELACEFPEDYTYMSDAYVKSVASKPYSKDPTIRRPLEYTMEKLTHVMEWREQAGAPDMESLVHLANGPDTAPEAVENPARLTKAKALVSSLNNASLYWHGVTKEGKPILWIRCGRKPWYPNVESEVNALILVADAGIKCMPEGVTDFVVVSDSNSPPPPVPSFMINVLKALVRGYPDRLSVLLSAPVSSIIQFVMSLLLPLMPGRLAGKFQLKDEEVAREILKGWLLHGEDDIPTFFHGKADHDALYPEEAYSKNKGQGTLKFDYFGMIERLQASAKEWEEMQKKK